jgi:hypothetical protein
MLRPLMVAALPLVSAPVAAQVAAPFAEGPSVAVGVGPDGGFRISEKLGIRANVMRLRELDPLPADLDRNLKLRSGGAMMDIYPLGGGFRLSFGVRMNNDENERAVPPPWTRMRSSYRIRDWAPSLTAGYAREWRSGLTVGVEAGALFQGVPRVRRWRAASSEMMAFENEFKDGKLRPMVQLSLGQRF